MKVTEKYLVQVLKRDQKLHYSWQTTLLFHEPECGFWATASRAPRSLDHHTKGQKFHFETHAMEWFWRGLPFSVGLSFDPTLKTVNYYCNIHEPLLASSSALTFVDLDLDVVKNNRFPYASVIDQEEFELHRVKYSYPELYGELVPKIANALVLRLEHEEIFKRPFVRKLFEHVFAASEGLRALPKLKANMLARHFEKNPWPLKIRQE